MRIRQLFSETLVYGISHVAARFLNYFLVPFYTGVFPREEYGVVSVLYSSIMFFSILMTLGMESAYLRYGKEEDKKSVFPTVVLLVAIAGGILSLLLYGLAPFFAQWFTSEYSGSTELWRYLILIVYFDALVAVPMADLRLSNKVWTFSLIKLGNVIINVALNFYFILGLHWGIEAILMANVIASGLTLIAGYLFTWSRVRWEWSAESMRTALAFGLPYVPAGIGYLVNETIDRFFLTTMSPETVAFLYGEGISALEVTGVYSACYKLSIFMTLIVQMFNMAWQPFYVKNFKNEGYKDMSVRIFELMNVAGMSIFLCVGLFAKEIVSLQIPGTSLFLIDDAYWWGLAIVPVLLVANWFKLWYYIFISGLVIREKTGKIPLVTVIGAGITLVLLTFLIPKFGMMGAAYTTLISFAVMAGIMYWFSQKEFRVDYPVTLSLLLIVLVAAPVLFDGLAFIHLDGFWGKVIYTFAGIGIISLLPLRRRFFSALG